MAKTKKSMRALAFIITVMMIACLAPTVSFAAVNTVTFEKSDLSIDGNKVTVKASINKGAELTMLAVRANTELTSLSGMSDAELENAIMYIDQVTMGDEDYTKTFELRDTAAGNVITVFVGGTDAAMVYQSDKVLTAVGTVTINGTDFVEGAAEQPKLTISDSDDTWFATLGKVVYVKGDDLKTPAGNVAADGTITIDTPSNEKTTYVVELTTPDGSDYDPYTKTFEFTYITAEGDKISKLPANLGVTVDKDSVLTKYTITVPEDADGVVYTVTVDGANQDLTTTRTFDVERPADDGNDETTLKKTVVVTATAGTATKTYTIEVLEQGAAAPAIKAENVEIVVAKDAYKAQKGEGYAVIIIRPDADTVDPKTQSIKVGGESLYYVEKPDYYVGVVSVYENETAVAEATTIEEATPSEKLVYGKAADASNIEKPVSAVDYGGAKRIVLKKDKTPSDKRLLSADVANGVMDGKITAVDYGTIKRVVLKKDADLAINMKK